MARRIIDIENAASLPRWQRPEALLVLMAIAMPLAFSTWSALSNNFIIERAGFDGSDNGWMHSLREVPGFLAFLAIFIIMFVREQVLALVSLITLGFGVMLTAEFPFFWGIMATTVISSIGFHYYETVNQSLQLQWLSKERAPKALGMILSAASAGSLVAYGAIVLTWETLGLDYSTVYIAGGGATVLLALAAWFIYPQFRGHTKQRNAIVLKRRYWLYYALTFMSGARRQIFLVFAAFMMVELFGFKVHEVTSLFVINYIAAMAFAPLVGQLVSRFGERLTLNIEYVGLILVFTSYACVYFFEWPWEVAAALYVVDHLLFSMALAQKTYFQKIADPEDIAPTAAVAFSINHTSAVFLPASLGYLWLVSPSAVFILAAGMAFGSLVLSRLVPRHPEKGHETILLRPPVSQPAE